MNLKKLLIVLFVLLVSAVPFTSALAQGGSEGDGQDGGDRPARRPAISDECRDALRALREAGETVTRDNLPEECEGLRRFRDRLPQLGECREAIRALREAGESVTRDNLPEGCEFPRGRRPFPGQDGQPGLGQAQ